MKCKYWSIIYSSIICGSSQHVLIDFFSLLYSVATMNILTLCLKFKKGELYTLTFLLISIVVECYTSQQYVAFLVVGKIVYRVTEESLMDRLNTITHLACLSIPESCR